MNGEGTLDDLYLEWLYQNFIGRVTNKNPGSSYWMLARQLYRKQYTWTIRNDRNRGEDGKQLRHEFINACDIQDVEVNWLSLPCSVLEMLIGLACRASFTADGAPGDWLWKFLRNLGIHSYNDRNYNVLVAEEVDAVISRLLDRNYNENGVGGLFPLENANKDQTKVELWSQLQVYLLEGNSLEDAS